MADRTKERIPLVVTIDERATQHLVDFCRHRGIDRLLVVADRNTWQAQGAAVYAALEGAELDVRSLVFPSEDVVADAEHVYQLLIALDESPRILVAVGSGTITDIVRFVAHRTYGDFISIPTAPSVDAYVSVGAPMIVNGVKVTYNAMPPIAVFADIQTLTDAPRAMIAAGFGDVLAKFTSVADFRLGHLVRGEMYDDAIAQRMLATAQSAAANAEQIAAADPEGVRVLMQALFDSGWCMVDFNNSRPASGVEHHYSHFWEMKLLREGRKAILHGAKTGVGTVLGAGLYATVRNLTRAEAADLLEASTPPDRDAEIATIRAVYGALSDEVVATQRSFLDMSSDDYDALKRRILENWERIQAIAADVPPPEQIAAWLRMAGGPGSVEELGLSAEEQRLAEQYAHLLRDRFTVRKLMRILGLHASGGA